MRGVLLTCMLTCVCFHAAAAQERREMGAHQHGHGALNIAIEGPA